MAVLTVVTPDRNGGEVWALTAAAGGGDSFPNTGKEFFHVKNGSGAPINVTFAHAGQVDAGDANLAVPDLVVAVAAGVERIVGPFPTQQYNDANNRVPVTYSDVTSVTVGVMKANV